MTDQAPIEQRVAMLERGYADHLDYCGKRAEEWTRSLRFIRKENQKGLKKLSRILAEQNKTQLGMHAENRRNMNRTIWAVLCGVVIAVWQVVSPSLHLTLH